MKATRREALIGALAVPTLAGVPRVAEARAGAALMLFDPALEAGRRLAKAQDGESLAIEGDRIRFARAVFERRPAFVVGVSRPADAFLIEDVASEAGYGPVGDGVEALREAIAGVRAKDRGVVLGWILAPNA